MPPSLTLIAEATRRSGVLWLSSAAVPPTLVWHLWHDDAAYVVCGDGEQGLAPLGPEATVTVRSQDGRRVVEWAARVERLTPDSADWDAVTPLLAAARLNTPVATGLPEHWAQHGTVLRLTPNTVAV